MPPAGFALQVIQESRTIRFAFSASINGSRYLIVGRRNQILAYKFQSRLPFLFIVDKFDFSDEIETAAELDGHICVLQRNQVTHLTMTADKFVTVSKANIENFKVDQQPYNYKSILAVGMGGYYLIHRYPGLVSIVSTVSTNQGPNTRTKKKSTRAFSIGTNIIERICFVTRSERTFAVLSRDYEFNYSLRYFTVDEEMSALSLSPRLCDFKEAPSLLFRAAGGVIVASDLALYFFPDGEATLDDNAGSPTYPVSRNKLKNVITLDLTGGGAPYRGLSFTAHTLIRDLNHDSLDQRKTARFEERHVLINDKGETLLVYIKTSQSATVNTTHDFQIVPLAKTTIACDLVQLDSNVFFAASRLSTSVMFRIINRPPYIDVCAKMTSTPPVLDIAICEEDFHEKLLVALGGFHSGQLEYLSGESCSVVQTTTLGLAFSAVSATLLNETQSHLIFQLLDLTSTQSYILDYSTYQITELRMLPENIPLCASIDGEAVAWMEGNVLYCEDQTYTSKELSDPVSLCALQYESHLDVLVCLSNNYSFHLRLLGSKLQLLNMCKETQIGTISGALLRIAGEQEPLVLIASSSGTLTQRFGREKTRGHFEETASVPEVQDWLRMKTFGLVDPIVSIFDSHRVWTLTVVEGAKFAERTLVLASNEPISDCFVVGDNKLGRVLSVHETRCILLQYAQIKAHDRLRDVYNSENAITNFLSFDEYVVAAELQICTGLKGVSRQSVLHLYNKGLKLLDTCKLPPGAKIGSMCDLTLRSELCDLFLVADNGTKTLFSYAIVNDKLTCCDKTSYDDLAEPGHKLRRFNSVQQLHLTDEELIIVGDRILEVDLEVDDHSFFWRLIHYLPSLPLPIAIGRVVTLDFLADGVSGIMSVRNDKWTSLTKSPFDPTFVTAMALCYEYVFFGDSIGNFAYFSVHSAEGEILGAINIGEQINVIRVEDNRELKVYIGTASGGIYSLLLFDPAETSEKKNYLGFMPYTPFKPKIPERPVPPVLQKAITEDESDSPRKSGRHSKRVLAEFDQAYFRMKWTQKWTNGLLE